MKSIVHLKQLSEKRTMTVALRSHFHRRTVNTEHTKAANNDPFYQINSTKVPRALSDSLKEKFDTLGNKLLC